MLAKIFALLLRSQFWVVQGAAYGAAAALMAQPALAALAVPLQNEPKVVPVIPMQHHAAYGEYADTVAAQRNGREEEVPTAVAMAWQAWASSEREAARRQLDGKTLRAVHEDTFQELHPRAPTQLQRQRSSSNGVAAPGQDQKHTTKAKSDDGNDSNDGGAFENLSQDSLLTKYKELRAEFATVLQRNKELEALVMNNHGNDVDLLS